MLCYIIVVGTTLSVVLHVSYDLSVIVATVVVVSYTFFCGLYSVASTDVLQLIFMIFGLLRIAKTQSYHVVKIYNPKLDCSLLYSSRTTQLGQF